MKSLQAILQAARKLGHDPTEPLRSPIAPGIKGYLIACERCEAFVRVADSTVAVGTLITTTCADNQHAEALRRLPQVASGPSTPAYRPQAVRKATNKQAVPLVSSGFKREVNNQPLQAALPELTVPASIAVCEYCGNGSTLVGKSCKHCQQPASLLVSAGRPPRGAQQRTIDEPPILPATIYYDHKPYILATYDRGDYIAPCGHSSKIRGVYAPRGYRPYHVDVTFLLRYPCRCATTIPELLDGLTDDQIKRLTTLDRQPDTFDGKQPIYISPRKQRWLDAVSVAAVIMTTDFIALHNHYFTIITNERRRSLDEIRAIMLTILSVRFVSPVWLKQT